MARDRRRMFFNHLENVVLPLVPTYIVQDLNDVRSFWFERNFSQSTYGEDAQYGTNSCTLIALLIPEIIARENVDFPLYELLPPKAVKTFAMAILEANKTYKSLDTGNMKYFNLNIPEGFNALRTQIANIAEKLFVHVNIVEKHGNAYLKEGTDKLTQTVRDQMDIYNVMSKPKYIFAILIGDGRSSFLCLENINNSVSYFDSHIHTEDFGAIVAQSDIRNLRNICCWILQMYINVYRSHPCTFEVSIVQTIHNG